MPETCSMHEEESVCLLTRRIMWLGVFLTICQYQLIGPPRQQRSLLKMSKHLFIYSQPCCNRKKGGFVQPTLATSGYSIDRVLHEVRSSIKAII